MNKADLINQISEDAGITKTQANDAIDAFTEAIAKALKEDQKVTLVGFGTFSVLVRAARKGRNPKTGDQVKIKAKRFPKFKAGKEFTSKI